MLPQLARFVKQHHLDKPTPPPIVFPEKYVTLPRWAARHASHSTTDLERHTSLGNGDAVMTWRAKGGGGSTHGNAAANDERANEFAASADAEYRGY